MKRKEKINFNDCSFIKLWESIHDIEDEGNKRIIDYLKSVGGELEVRVEDQRDKTYTKKLCLPENLPDDSREKKFFEDEKILFFVFENDNIKMIRSLKELKKVLWIIPDLQKSLDTLEKEGTKRVIEFLESEGGELEVLNKEDLLAGCKHGKGLLDMIYGEKLLLKDDLPYLVFDDNSIEAIDNPDLLKNAFWIIFGHESMRKYQKELEHNMRKIHFEGEDIIITDPCYLESDKTPENMEDIGITNYISRNTIYGDWSCTTFNTDTNEPIGKFCADGGEVIVCSLKDALKYNPDFDYHITKNWTTTLIKNFTGDVWFEVETKTGTYEEDTPYYKKGETWEDKFLHIIGEGNINFKTLQTGL